MAYTTQHEIRKISIVYNGNPGLWQRKEVVNFLSGIRLFWQAFGQLLRYTVSVQRLTYSHCLMAFLMYGTNSNWHMLREDLRNVLLASFTENFSLIKIPN